MVIVKIMLFFYVTYFWALVLMPLSWLAQTVRVPTLGS